MKKLVLLCLIVSGCVSFGSPTEDIQNGLIKTKSGQWFEVDRVAHPLLPCKAGRDARGTEWTCDGVGLDSSKPIRVYVMDEPKQMPLECASFTACVRYIHNDIIILRRGQTVDAMLGDFFHEYSGIDGIGGHGTKGVHTDAVDERPAALQRAKQNGYWGQR